MGRPKKIEEEVVDEVLETEDAVEVEEVVDKKKSDVCVNCENSGADCYLCGGYKPNVKRVNKGVCDNCENSGLDCYLCGGYKK